MDAPPPFSLEVSSGARRALRRLPSKVAHAVIEFMTGALVENPLRVSESLRLDLAEFRSARRGDYRILIRVEEEPRTVLVVSIDHRADAYRAR